MTLKTLVIGIGNRFRGDDGAGLLAAQMLSARGLPDLEVMESDGSSFSLMSMWEGHEHVVLIDALQANARQPGEILKLAPEAELLRDASQCSTHAFGVSEAIALSRALGTLPKSLKIIGIVGATFEMSESISPAIAEAAKTLASTWTEFINERGELHA